MSTPFTFPPPPPPPPKPANTGHTSGHSSRGQFQNQTFRGQGAHGGSRGRGRGRGSFRGSGHHRGHHQGGASRGGPPNAQDAHRTQSSSGILGNDFGSPGSSVSRHGSAKQEPTPFKRDSEQKLPGMKSRKDEIPKVPAVPPTPAFGQFIPGAGSTMAPMTNVKPEWSSEPAKKKRKVNQLGLTPIDENVSDEDVDEEAKYASMGQKLVIEYNGAVSTLNSSEDIQAWIEERKRKWPTRARVEAKQKEAEAAAKAARERRLADVKQLVEDSKTIRGYEKSRDHKRSGKQGHGQKNDAQRDRRIAKLERELEKLKAESAKADKLSAEKAARLPTPDEDDNTAAKRDQASASQKGAIGGLEAYDETSSPAPSSVLSDSESSEVSSDEEDGSSSAEDASSKGSAPPEEEPSQKPEAPIRVAPPPRRQISKVNDRDTVKVPRGVCPQFYHRGRCHRGRGCRLKHLKPEEPRKSLYQRLVEQEKAAENLKVVQAVKMLGQQGFFDDLKCSSSTLS